MPSSSLPTHVILVAAFVLGIPQSSVAHPGVGHLEALERGELIVLAEIASRQGFERKDLPWTRFDLKVQETFRGPAIRELSIEQLGGMAENGLRLSTSNAVPLEVGQTYVLALLPTRDGFTIAGARSGALQVVNGEAHTLDGSPLFRLDESISTEPSGRALNIEDIASIKYRPWLKTDGDRRGSFVSREGTSPLSSAPLESTRNKVPDPYAVIGQELPIKFEVYLGVTDAYLETISCLDNWNDYVGVFEQRIWNGAGIGNGQNEYIGFMTNEELYAAVGTTWGLGAGMAYTWYNGSEVIESDVIMNAHLDWTNLIEVAQAGRARHFRQVMMHELGHVWGAFVGGAEETYDYCVPTVMHGVNVLEDGYGIQPIDARLLRDLYEPQNPTISSMTDLGIEAYWADGGLRTARLNRLEAEQGESVTIQGMTATNMSIAMAEGVTVRFFLSHDRTAYNSSKQVGSEKLIGYFHPESWVRFDYQFQVPTNFPSGRYWVGAIISHHGWEPDDYEPNNTTYLLRQLTVVPSRYVEITFKSDPPDQSFWIDGQQYQGTHKFQWLRDSSHTISASESNEFELGRRFQFTRWRGGIGAGEAPGAEIVASQSMTYTAEYREQALLTLQTQGDGAIEAAGGWYDLGETLEIEATGISDAFTEWRGLGDGGYSGCLNPTEVEIEGPIAQTAVFGEPPTEVQLKLESTESAASVLVDGNQSTLPYATCFEVGSSVRLEADETVELGPGERMAFAGWSDGVRSRIRILDMRTSTTLEAQYQVQYLVQVIPSHGGIAQVDKSWFFPGAVAEVSAVADCEFNFQRWETSADVQALTQGVAQVEVAAPVAIRPIFGGGANVELEEHHEPIARLERDIEASVWIDLDGDQRPELVAATKDGLEAFRLQEDGSLVGIDSEYEEIPVEDPYLLSVTDVDADGHQDLFIADNESVLLAMGGLGSPDRLIPLGSDRDVVDVVWSDLDLNGRVDFLVATDEMVRHFEWAGDGPELQFSPYLESIENARDLAIGDVSGDQHPEVFVATKDHVHAAGWDSGTVQTTQIDLDDVIGLECVDTDLDGLDEVVVLTEEYVVLVDWDEVLNPVVSEPIWSGQGGSLVKADFDRDRDWDLAIGPFNSDLFVLQNNVDQWEERSFHFSVEPGRNPLVHVLDVDRDGFEDLTVTWENREEILAMRNGGSCNGALEIHLEADGELPPQSLRIDIGGAVRHDLHVESGKRYGVGGARYVDSVTAVWPDGHRRTFEQVDAAMPLTVRRSESVSVATAQIEVSWVSRASLELRWKVVGVPPGHAVELRRFGRGGEVPLGQYSTVQSWQTAIDRVSETPLGYRLVQADTGFVLAEASVPEPPESRQVLNVMAPYPNPFNPAVTIEFEVGTRMPVSVVAYNTAGRRVGTVLDTTMDAGAHAIVWNAEDLASGIYFIQVRSENRQSIHKVVLLK